MDFKQRMMIGCLGALAPILASLLVVDFRTTLADVQVLDGLSYMVRLLALCGAACLVVYLNSDEERPVKLFQLGIAAPAILTTLIAGANVSSNKPKADTESKTKTSFSFVGSAYAQPTAGSMTAKNCGAPQELTAGERILKGLVGMVPDNEWFVVAGSFPNLDSAAEGANQIQRRFAGKFQAAICQPLGGADLRYRVVIAENQSYSGAAKMKIDAIKAGLSSETWIWNPIEMSKTLQK